MINANCNRVSITDDHSLFWEMSSYRLIPARSCRSFLKSDHRDCDRSVIDHLVWCCGEEALRLHTLAAYRSSMRPPVPPSLQDQSIGLQGRIAA